MRQPIDFLVLFISKILQPVEYEILNDWFHTLVANDSCHLDLISRLNAMACLCHHSSLSVYLRAKPETCLERIRTRNRPEEQSITLDYLKQLDDRHEQWLASRTLTNQTSVLFVDANQSPERVYRDTNTHLVDLVSC